VRQFAPRCRTGNCCIHNKNELYYSEGDRSVSETHISYLGGDILRNKVYLALSGLHHICARGICCTPNSSCHTERLVPYHQNVYRACRISWKYCLLIHIDEFYPLNRSRHSSDQLTLSPVRRQIPRSVMHPRLYRCGDSTLTLAAASCRSLIIF
jgi:hypothetical protein